ncbi:MAG: hypothetical protein KJ804_15425 [Proteobacteria bacterium]|nr:hypothetical protein [Pseudomonadota bacterium]
MSQTSKQLENVFKEITSHFSNVSQIIVTPEEGNPPEQYKVTYHLPGVCKNDEGQVYPCDQHVISIALPFGFPHFPPNCRPETPIFHPDFDSSAICIGDAWQADQSIVKLILHIGHMISGEIYSLNNAFNEEAAEWYQEHRDQLPFGQPAFSASPAKPAAKEAEIEMAEIDILSDDDFSHSFSLEKEEESTGKESPSSLSATIDIDRLRIVAKQKRFHTLSQELQAIDSHFNGREQLEIQTREAMNKATALYREADDLEHRGEHKKALAKYQAAGAVVSDYPLLEEAKKRIQQSLDLLGDWVTGEKNEIEAEGNDVSEDDAESSLEETSSAPSSAKGERTFYEEEKTRGSRWPLYTIGGGSVALLVTLVLSYFSLSSGLKEAQKKVSECRTMLEANNFSGAEQKCVEARDLISSVQLIKQNEKEILAEEIQTLLTSEKLRQGLAGKTLLDGKFVSESTKALILTFKEAKNNGDTLLQQKIWQEAIPHYEKALEAASKTTAVDQKLVVEIRRQLSRARFNSLMLAGEKSLSTSDWQGASKHFAQALELAKTDPNVPVENIAQLEILSNQTKFNTLRDQGKVFFDNNEWLAALETYEQAQKLAAQLELPEAEAISALHESIARTKIYMTVEKGQEAFAATRWDDAIRQYEHAIILLEENSKLLTQIDTKDSRDKLSRIMLHASIIRDKQDVAKHLKAEKYGPALAKLQNIQKSITASPFAKQPEFQIILQEISTQIETAQTQLLITDKSTYLIDNFKKLFLKHYPAAARSTLSSPKVEYLKNREGKLLFRMQCTEESGGRPIRLQMNYLFTPATGQWEFSNDEDQ